MNSQSTSAILMVRPGAFGFDANTATTNAFQRELDLDPQSVHRQAVDEFDNMVSLLVAEGIDVNVFVDRPFPPKPNAIFPNNWFSTHGEGTAVVYPMQSPSRQSERDFAVFDHLQADGWRIDELIDLSSYEVKEQYLEGTGSMIFDHAEHRVFACLSERTHPELFETMAYELDCFPIAFHGVDANGLAIYHTNVMLAIGTKWAVVCAEAIVDAEERAEVLSCLADGGKEVVEISLAQMGAFAGNMIELKRPNGELLIVMSQSAHDSLEAGQVERLSKQARLFPIPVPTIEAVGGGSVRCMIAEVFLPPQESGK